MSSANNELSKRVLVFVPEFPVVSETFIEREISALARFESLDVKVFSIRRGFGDLSPNLTGRIFYIAPTVSNIIYQFFYFLFLHPFRFFKAFFVVGVRNPYIFVKSFGYAFHFKEFKPHIIYAHFMSKPSTICLVVSVLLKCDFAVAAHARDIIDYPDLPKEKLKHAKFITICNRNALVKYQNLCGEKLQSEFSKKVHLNYHGVELDAQKPLFAKEKVILSVGRLVPKKGYEYLIKAFASITKAYPEHKLVLVGKGPLLREYNQLIQELGIESKVIFLGEKRFREVRELMTVAELYIQPSINIENDEDGIPNTLIEAALLRLPIITTDAGSISEFLTKKEALIVLQKDSKQLSEAIKSCLSDKALSTNLGNLAYEKAARMFNLTQNTKEIESLLAKDQ